MRDAQRIAIRDHEARLAAADRIIGELTAITAVLYVALDEMIRQHGATPRAAEAIARVTGDAP